MTPPKVSHCANPKCTAEFKRLGEGRLFIQRINPKSNANRLQQKAIWLCNRCARHFEVAFDDSRQSYHLVQHSRTA